MCVCVWCGVCVCARVYMNVESHSLSMFALMYEGEHPPLVSTFTLAFAQCVFVWRDFCFLMCYFLPLCLFNHLFVSICTDIYFFPTVSYNLKLHYSVVAQIVPALDTGRFLRHRSYLAMW